MTKARNQPFCLAHDNNIGYFLGKDVFPKSSTEKNEALYANNNLFCLNSKSDGVSFKRTIEEIKSENNNS